MATMPTEPANLNPPVMPVGQALTMKELQVFRPATNMVCLSVVEEFAKQRRRYEGPLTEAARILQTSINECLMDAMQLQREGCADITLKFADCVEEHTSENAWNRAPLKCTALRKSVEECVVSQPNYLTVKAKHEFLIPPEAIGEKKYLKALANWKDKTEEEKAAVLEKFSSF